MIQQEHPLSYLPPGLRPHFPLFPLSSPLTPQPKHQPVPPSGARGASVRVKFQACL